MDFLPRLLTRSRSKLAVEELLGTDQFVWILAMSRFGPQKGPRIETKRLLSAQGVDHVLPFETILRGLIDFTKTDRHYGHSNYLHLIRLLKVYEFLG